MPSGLSGCGTSLANRAQAARSSSTYGDSCSLTGNIPPDGGRPPARRYPYSMCGIVGYVGRRSALDVGLGGLQRLEYRGYDSAGVALVADGPDGTFLASAKRAGKLANLIDALEEQPLPVAHTGI